MENVHLFLSILVGGLLLLVVLLANGRALRAAPPLTTLAEGAKIQQVVIGVNIGPLYQVPRVVSSTTINNETQVDIDLPPPPSLKLKPSIPKPVDSDSNHLHDGIIQNIQKFDWQRNRDAPEHAPHVLSRMTVRKLAKHRDPSAYYLFGIQLPFGKNQHASELVVMNSTGVIVASKAFPGQRIWLAAFANSTTIYGLATASDTDWDWNTTAHFVLFNFKTGVRVDVPLPGGTHWLEFDSHTRSLIWLKNRFVQINCNRVDHTKAPRKQTKAVAACPPSFVFGKVRHTHVVTDDIIEMNLKGRRTFHWDIFERLTRATRPSPFKFQPMPMRKWRGKSRGHPDYIHANCVFRDPAEDTVYLNSLSLSSLLKIKRRTGELIWVIGEHSNSYMMFDEYGRQVDTIFRLAHSVNYLGNNRFLVFDNGGANVKGAPGSRLVIFQVYDKNRTAHILWQWSPETKAENTALARGNGGGTHPLLDGSIIGAFGEPWTQYLVEVHGQERVMDVQFQNAFIQDVTAFYNQPVLKVIKLADNKVVLHCYNAYRELRETGALLQIHELCSSGNSPAIKPLRFLPFWQPTPITVRLPAGKVRLTLQNADGLQGHHIIDRPCPAT